MSAPPEITKTSLPRLSLAAAGFLITTSTLAWGGPAETVPAPVLDGDLRLSQLVGASVQAAGGQVVGAVDDIIISADGHAKMVIVGLAGALGLGEKDVALPFDAIVRTFTDPRLTQRQVFSGTGLYGGSSETAVVLRQDLAALRAAPAFVSPGSQDAVGQPSPASGVPESVDKQPKSSTESGGPG